MNLVDVPNIQNKDHNNWVIIYNRWNWSLNYKEINPPITKRINNNENPIIE